MDKFAETIKDAAVADNAEIKKLDFNNGTQYIDQLAGMLLELSSSETEICERQGYTFYAKGTNLDKTIEMIRTSFSDDTLYGLFVKGELEGMAIHNTNWSTIYGLHVNEAVRRKGYAKRLMETIMSNHTVNHIHVIPGNLPAIRLYESLGFELNPIMQMNNKNK